MESNTSTNGGIGFFTVLFFIFLVLKLTDVITWSWWAVTAPLWAPTLLVVAGLIVGFVIYLIFKAIASRF